MKRRWLIALLVVFALSVTASLLFFRFNSSPAARQRTSSGEFELLDVTVRDQVFREGSQVQRMFERFIPRLGVNIGGVRLRRAIRHKDRDDAPMTAWLLYRGTQIRTRATPPLFGSRVIIEDSSGKQFENSVPMVQRSSSNEMLISIPLSAFPGEEEQFLLRFSPPLRNSTNREWVEFKIKNPLYPWVPEWTLNQTNQVNGFSIALRKITLEPATCEFELPGAGWSVDSCTIQDTQGNQLVRTGMRTQRSTCWCKFNQRLETGRVWRIDLTLVNPVDSPPDEARILSLSANAQPQNITNQAGRVFSCAFNGSTFSISCPRESESPLLGWIITGATNQNSGEPLNLSRFAPATSSVSEQTTQMWPPLESYCSNIVLRLAYPATLRTHFTFGPTNATRAN